MSSPPRSRKVAASCSSGGSTLRYPASPRCCRRAARRAPGAEPGSPGMALDRALFTRTSRGLIDRWLRRRPPACSNAAGRTRPLSRTTVNGPAHSASAGCRGLASRSHPRFSGGGCARGSGSEREQDCGRDARRPPRLHRAGRPARRACCIPLGGLPPSGRIDGRDPGRRPCGTARHRDRSLPMPRRRSGLPSIAWPGWLLRIPPPDLAPWLLAPVDAMAPPSCCGSVCTASRRSSAAR